jgi:hypothetical protein
VLDEMMGSLPAWVARGLIGDVDAFVSQMRAPYDGAFGADREAKVRGLFET